MTCATLKRSLELDPHHFTLRPQKRRRCMATAIALSTPPVVSPRDHQSVSPFGLAINRLSSDVITNKVREEMRRLYRRKQLHFGDSNAVGQQSLQLSSTNSPQARAVQTILSTPSNTSLIKQDGEGLKDKPLFTFTQVGLICEKMVLEREDELREVYEQALTSKLAEQYDMFVKFTHDQLKKRFETSSVPSYLS